MSRSTANRSGDPYDDWEQKYLNSLGGNPLSPRFRRARIVKVAHRIARKLFRSEDFFLGQISGIVHVGANVGEECDRYAEYGLSVLWIEPNPKAFQTLTKALRFYPRQTAVSYLVADIDNKDCVLHACSNSAGSSSIFEFAAHKGAQPEGAFTEEIPLKTVTLSSLIARENVDMNRFDSLVIDAQGTELLVLRGAADLLSRFKFIKTKAADVEVCKEYGSAKDIDTFLQGRGFRLVSKKPFARKSGAASFYDLIYSRESWKKLRSMNLF